MGNGQAAISDLDHIGIVVKDIQRSANFYSLALGIGSFRIFELQVTEEMLRGFPPGTVSPGKTKIGIAQKGSVIIELIEVVEGKSLFSDFLESMGEGVHHLGCDVADLEKEVARLEGQGMETVLRGKTGEGGVVFLRGEGSGGVLVELLQSEKSLAERLESMQKRL